MVDLLSVLDPLFRARNRDLRSFHQLWLKAIAPLAAVGAEFLQICNQAFQVIGFGHQGDGCADVFLIRCKNHREFTALRHEQQTVGVGCKLDLLIALKVKQFLGRRCGFQRAVAVGVGDDLSFVWPVEQRGEARHDGIRREHARIPEVGQMPGVAVLEADP